MVVGTLGTVDGPTGTPMVSGGFEVGGGDVGVGGVVGGGGGGVITRAGVAFRDATGMRTTGGRIGTVTTCVVGAVVGATVERGAPFLTAVATRPCVRGVTACALNVGLTSVAW
ncbi:MAG: hypothetical protein JWM72_3117 [Actinomycetia bacterium]|nr:hypothetical protein [Actinomycetes bacterium]